MKHLLTLMLCLGLFLAPIAQAQDENFLDLTKIKVAEKEEKGPKTGKGAFASVGHTRPTKIIPLKVTLLSLDKLNYQLGEEVIYEVMLENITEEILVIPWSSNLNAVKPDEANDPPGYVDAHLSLVVKDQISGDQFIGGQGLYGSHLMPSSLKRLWPGQTVRIRVPGQWYFSSADVAKRTREKLPQTFEVWARFSFVHGTSTERYEPAVSINSLTVELKKWQE